MDPSIKHLIESDYQWIFVGGKGGVGKTTTSCALGIILSQYKSSVLIISTDPAHNLSDSFDQKFSGTPTLVNGFSNLFAMEIDPEAHVECNTGSQGPEMFKDLLGSLPGIDEAVSFAKVAELADNLKYSLVIFDTAPTGHTLRLLSFPLMLSSTIKRFEELRTTLFPLLKQMGSLLGSDFKIDEVVKKIEDAIPMVERVSSFLTDPSKTTFICVCIAEFLSLYETDRLITQLRDMNVSSHTIVVNQLVKPGPACAQCELCTSREKSQSCYLTQINGLFSDYHVVKSYLLASEVRGVEQLKEYSKFLLGS